MTDQYILEMVGITKTFPGVRALDDVTLRVRPGEVHALMGENGAGKSTLMKILSGIYQADSGTITFQGAPLVVHSPRESMDAGIAMIHQELSPILDMSVAENIFLGREPKRSGLGWAGMVDHKAMVAETRELLSHLGITLDPRRLMRSLSVAQMQLVEIVKAISLDARLIIMDEPTSAITDTETELLFEQIAALKQRGVGIVYISHKMDEIFRIADHITVLRDGRFAGSAPASEISRDELITLMVNRKLEDVFPERHATIGEPALTVTDLSWADRVKGVSFEVRRGEVLGIAGLVGSGRSELVEAVFGVRQPSGGSVAKGGQIFRARHPKDAIRQGIALITEDRKATGLNLVGSVQDNVTLVSLSELASAGVISGRKEVAAAERYIGGLRIKTPSRQTPIASLSGGNQQKVVLAKWLLSEPDVVIFDEPTRGIDIGAKREIYALINELAEGGRAIVVISSEMPELIGLADRVLVMCEGRATGELTGADINQEAIMALASGIDVAAR